MNSNATLVKPYDLFVLEVLKAWVDPAQKHPKTIGQAAIATIAVTSWTTIGDRRNVDLRARCVSEVAPIPAAMLRAVTDALDNIKLVRAGSAHSGGDGGALHRLRPRQVVDQMIGRGCTPDRLGAGRREPS